MDSGTERERLRATFDGAAADYQEARPGYPDALYMELLARTGALPETDALCEVGAASGKATLLRPGGHLAFWEAIHVIPADGDPFFSEIQDVYDEIGEGMPGGWVSPTVETLPSL